MAQSSTPPPDFAEALLAILARYVSPPTAQSILKLARQRAGVSTPRLDRAQLGDMFAAIENNLRLFVSEPSHVDDCCAAIVDLLGARSFTHEARSTPSVPPASSRLSEPPSARLAPPASVRLSVPATGSRPSRTTASTQGQNSWYVLFAGRTVRRYRLGVRRSGDQARSCWEARRRCEAGDGCCDLRQASQRSAGDRSCAGG